MKVLSLLKNKKVLIGLAAMVMLSITIVLFLAEAAKDAQDRENRIKQAEIRLQEFLCMQDAKKDIIAELKECQPFINFRKKEPKRIKKALLREIEKMISTSGGSIAKLALQETPIELDLSIKYIADIQLDLTFSELLRFLGQIKTSPLLIKLDKFAIGFSGRNSEKLVVNGVLSVSISGVSPKDA